MTSRTAKTTVERVRVSRVRVRVRIGTKDARGKDVWMDVGVTQEEAMHGGGIQAGRGVVR